MKQDYSECLPVVVPSSVCFYSVGYCHSAQKDCHSEWSEESQGSGHTRCFVPQHDKRNQGGCMYWVYIVTNHQKTVLYTGVTNNLMRRLEEHKFAAHTSQQESFCGKYKTYHLLFAECFQQVNDAIANEKRIKGWRRDKKIALINQHNPNWDFLEQTL